MCTRKENYLTLNKYVHALYISQNTRSHPQIRNKELKEKKFARRASVAWAHNLIILLNNNNIKIDSNLKQEIGYKTDTSLTTDLTHRIWPIPQRIKKNNAGK